MTRSGPMEAARGPSAPFGPLSARRWACPSAPALVGTTFGPLSARRWACLSMVLGLVFTPAGRARADEPRLRTDLAPSLAAGVDAGATSRPVAEARLLYLATAGVYGRATSGPGAFGLEARPFALPRLLSAADTGTFGDLVVGSLRLSMGASFSRAGRALELGTGVDVPLGGYAGPFLSFDGLYRVPEPSLRGAQPGELRALVTIGFRLAVLSHLVDLGDRAPE